MGGSRAAKEGACQQRHGAPPDGINKSYSDSAFSAEHQPLHIAAFQQQRVLEL